MPAPTRLKVAGSHPYDVVVGHGLLGELPDLLKGADRVAVIHPPTMRGQARAIEAALPGAHLVEVPDGEAQKDVKVAAHCWDTLGDLGFTRTDAIVGVGGGATTDLAGFVAATWLRGVAVVHIPTTLLAMV